MYSTCIPGGERVEMKQKLPVGEVVGTVVWYQPKEEME